MYDDFMCRCSPESAARAQSILDEVKQRLNADDSNLLSNILYSLEFDYDSEIESLIADQWGGVSASKRKFDKNLQKYDGYEYNVDVQCDMFEDGIAYVWKMIADREDLKKVVWLLV